MSEHTFATVINCMDGRTQLPVNEWTRKMFNVDFVDTITEPGPDKILCEGPDELIESIKSRVSISVNKHGSNHVILVSHTDCAGNPVDKATHLRQLKKAVHIIATWGFAAHVIGIWVGELWSVQKIEEL